MTAQKAIIVDGGKLSQIPSIDTLVVGAGIDSSGATLTIGNPLATTVFPGPVQLDGEVSTVAGTVFQTSATFEGNVIFGTGVAPDETVTFNGATISSDIAFTAPGHKITNLANGTNPNDAVNFSQLSALVTGVSSFQTSLSGLTPSSATGGAITLAGTLGVTSGGTGATSLTLGSLLAGNGAGTVAEIAPGSNGQVLTVVSGAWAAAAAAVTATAQGGANAVQYANSATPANFDGDNAKLAFNESTSQLSVGTGTANETLTVNGRVSIAEGSAPSPTAAFGKLWANSAAASSSLQAADARPYWTDDTGQSYNLTLDRFNTLTPAASVAIDTSPALPVFNSLSLDQNTTFTTSNLGNGRSASVRVVGDASTRTLTFPVGWTWLGSGPPADLAAGDVGYLSITAYGATDADVVAAWSYENAPAAVTGSGVDNQIAVWSGTNTQDGSASLTFDGTTLGVTGAAVSLTANAASSLTTSSGALTLTSAAAATWSTATGDLNLTATANSVVVTGAEAAVDAVTITSSNAAGGVDVNAGTGGVTIDTTAAFSIDGATSSNVTVTGSAQSLTLAAAGGGAQKVLVQSAGTGVDAIDLVASAGGFSIDGVAASNVSVTGANLTLSTITSGAVNLTAANNLQISANGNGTTWPTAAGSAGQVLTNNGVGALSWATPSTSVTTVDIPATANEDMLAGDLVSYIFATTARVQQADANGAGTRATPVGFVTTAAVAGLSTTLRVAGIATVPTTNFDVAPTTANVGAPIYMSETAGRVTLTAPSVASTVSQKVGVLFDVSGGNASVLIQIGDPIVIQ
jgi:hypothetical protein